jgi:predicted RNase H-like HicB family nuclease
MDDPANLTFSSSVLVRIEANVPWMWRKGSGGNYVAVCDPLKITLQAQSYSELMDDIADSLDALLKDLMESDELEQFMQEHGWRLVAPIPPRPKDMRFDVPFSIMPVAMAGANGPQRSFYQ